MRRLFPLLSVSKTFVLPALLVTLLGTTSSIAYAALAPVAAGSPNTAKAGQEAPPTDRAVITADELSHDKNLDTVTARGNVEVQYEGRILLADTVNYQVTADRATATGNVIITDKDGTTTFADFAEITGDMKEGFAREARVLLTDGSRAAARTATRKTNAKGESVTEMENTVYSACDVCSDTPGSDTRLWQIKSKRVVHDQQAGDITYNDVWLELFGVPVAYSPYLSHPDPSVKRRSGFLPPSYKANKAIGFGVNVPYFAVIDDQQDATISLLTSSDEYPLLQGEYRGVGHSTNLKMSGSIIREKSERIRNHFSADLKHSIDDTFRAGADINLASDRTYLRRYRLANPTYLTSRAYLEGFNRRSYGVLEGLSFQNVSSRESKLGGPPLVAPMASWNYSSEPGPLGAYTTADISAVSLTRDPGASSNRVSATYGWHLPHIGPIGDVYQLDVSMAGDAYYVNSVLQEDGDRYSGTVGRLVPQAALTWSLPLQRRTGSVNEVIRPIIQGVVSPRGQNSSKIPNEDSLNFEFDDTNLFSTNRFPGRDRVEGGARINYGIEYSASHRRFGQATAMLGQSYRINNSSDFSAATGLQENQSDYVGRMSLRPSSNFDFIYRFRADKDSGRLHRSEIISRIGPPIFSVTARYGKIDRLDEEQGGFKNREEIYLGFASQLSRYWSLGAYGRYDLADGSSPIGVVGYTGYEDECFALMLNVARDYTYDLDYAGGLSFGFRFALKTLGEFQSTLGLGNSDSQ